jgi:hypothetical protein
VESNSDLKIGLSDRCSNWLVGERDTVGLFFDADWAETASKLPDNNG